MNLLLIAAFAAMPVYAQELNKQEPSAYRLDPSKNAVFRLNVNGNANSNSENDAEVAVTPAISALLAGKPYAALIHKAAHDSALNPALVHAVIQVESGYNATARSPKGAIGLMQLMPATAARYGVRDPGRSPEANIRAGTRYLSDLMQQFGGRVDLVLAAYNAGENAVVRHGMRIPPYPETQHYVPAVLAKYHEWEEPPPTTPQEYIQYLPGTRLRN